MPNIPAVLSALPTEKAPLDVYADPTILPIVSEDKVVGSAVLITVLGFPANSLLASAVLVVPFINTSLTVGSVFTFVIVKLDNCIHPS